MECHFRRLLSSSDTVVAELEVCPAYPRDSFIPATSTIAVLAFHPRTDRQVETNKCGGILQVNSYYHHAEAWDADRELVVFVSHSIRSPSRKYWYHIMSLLLIS